MEDARPVPLKLLRVQSRPIPLMALEPIVGGEAIVEDHERIAQHLGHDGGAANHVTALIPMHEGAARDRGGRSHGAVDECHIRDDGEMGNRQVHGVERRLEDVPLIDDVRAHDAKPDVGVGLDDREGARALPSGEPFGVVDANRKIGAMQEDGGCDDRTGPRTSSGFIDPGNTLSAVDPPVAIAGDRAMSERVRTSWARREELAGRR